MTREEAKSCKGTIEMLQRLAYNIHGVMDVIDADNCKKIIKALEQEPCEDCVRRQAVIDAINANCVFENEYNLTASRILNAVEALPSVTPKPKTGRWTEHFDESGKWYECDQCHTDWGGPVNYCPNCGAKMEGDKR